MKALLLVFLLAFVACLTAQGYTAESTTVYMKERAEAVRRDINNRGLIAIAERSDDGIALRVKKGCNLLREAGDVTSADYYEYRFESKYRGFLMKMVSQRKIGDFKPLSQYLADLYDRVEFTVGISVCQATHFSDLKTYNFCLPVVLHPKDYSESDYRDHFAGDGIYYGLIPVLSWDACEIGLLAIGVMVPVCGGAEWVMGTFIAPRLSDFVYSRFVE